MRREARSLILALFVVVGAAALVATGETGKTARAFTPAIPKTWDSEEIAAMMLPLADRAASPKHVSEDYYYQIPVRPIFKSYPVYAPGREPAGYREWLEQQTPEPAFDASKLETKEDWIRAGETVFDAPTFYDAVVTAADVRDPAWYDAVEPRVAKDGTLPYFRYVVREKGKVELGTISCTMCHTRVTDDGTVLKGAQGNLPFERASVYKARERIPIQGIRAFERSFFSAPWVKPDPMAGVDQIPFETFADWHSAIPPGVIARQGSSPTRPLQVPDLIGVEDVKYLDHTGVQRHRSIADMMRYAALNQGADDLSSYAGFVPAARDGRTQPDPKKKLRYSDEQLYALSLYIYSLVPPENPNRFDALAARGWKVFVEENCASCHTPPLYTNNMLTPVDGFQPPASDRVKYDVMGFSVGTDPFSALKTRRGTGYYKVPSLRGVWYRGPFEHNGSVASLEDWFDPRRLRDDYVPTGFRGAGVTARAVKGHPFGLGRSAEDRKALVAFLKTL